MTKEWAELANVAGEAPEVGGGLDQIVPPGLLLQLQPLDAELGDEVHDGLLNVHVEAVRGQTDQEHSVRMLRQVVPPPLLCVLVIGSADLASLMSLDQDSLWLLDRFEVGGWSRGGWRLGRARIISRTLVALATPVAFAGAMSLALARLALLANLTNKIFDA